MVVGMKKYISSIILLFTISACSVNIPTDSLSFEDKVATQSSIVMTATALHNLVEKEDNLVQSTDTPGTKEDPTVTPTTPTDNPKSDLGQPAWRDDLSSGKNWNLDTEDQVFGNTRFFHENGYLGATSSATTSGYIWWLNFLEFKDAYLEATFEVGSCAGDDQYGLVFRAPDYTSGFGYYFTVTCDGRYSIRRWNASGSTLLFDLTESSEFNSGSNQTNTLGIWVKGNSINIFVNERLIKEIQDNSLQSKGHFGLFINARQTPGFTIKMHEIAYWLLK
jgi:hypothetical protein